MMKYIKEIFITLFLFVACKSKDHNYNDSNKTPVSVDIPISQRGDTSHMYKFIKKISKNFQLDTLEFGYDSLQIRIWGIYQVYKNDILIVIKNKKSTWYAEVFRLNEMSIDRKKFVPQKVDPKSGWDNFIRKLFSLKIDSLPDMNKIGLKGAIDGNSFSVEFSSKNKYRYYQFINPDLYQKQSPEAKDFVRIFLIIEDEFGLKDILGD